MYYINGIFNRDCHTVRCRECVRFSECPLREVLLFNLITSSKVVFPRGSGHEEQKHILCVWYCQSLHLNFTIHCIFYKVALLSYV